MTSPVKVAAGRWALILLGALAPLAKSAEPPPGPDVYRVVTWSSMSDRTLSPLATLIQGAEGTRWRHAESDRVMAHAATLDELGALMDEAHYAWRAVGQQLGLPPPARRARLIYVYETATWDRLTREGGIRPDGLALQVGSDIVLKVDAAQQQRLDRIAHELVHFRLREAYGDRLPLWLEEGLATRMGVRIARDFNNTKGQPVAGQWPAVAADDLLEPEVLLSYDHYPESPAAAQAFGRQAAELVELLSEKIGPARWPSALREIGARGDWRSVLASGYGVDMTSLHHMVTLAASRSARPWVF